MGIDGVAGRGVGESPVALNGPQDPSRKEEECCNQLKGAAHDDSYQPEGEQ